MEEDETDSIHKRKERRVESQLKLDSAWTAYAVDAEEVGEPFGGCLPAGIPLPQELFESRKVTCGTRTLQGTYRIGCLIRTKIVALRLRKLSHSASADGDGCLILPFAFVRNDDQSCGQVKVRDADDVRFCMSPLLTKSGLFSYCQNWLIEKDHLIDKYKSMSGIRL